MRATRQPKALWWRMAHPEGEVPKTRRRLRRRSKAYEERMAVYRTARLEFLQAHPYCAKPGCQRRSEEVHHSRGRAGVLLLLRAFWCALCGSCHHWVNEHPAAARDLGLLCQPGDWNRPPSVHTA